MSPPCRKAEKPVPVHNEGCVVGVTYSPRLHKILVKVLTKYGFLQHTAASSETKGSRSYRF